MYLKPGRNLKAGTDTEAMEEYYLQPCSLGWFSLLS